MPEDSPIADNLQRGMTLRIKTPTGWDEVVTPGGVEGRRFVFLIRQTFNPPDDPRNLGGASGLPGLYKVMLVLQKPGYSEHPPGNHLTEEQLEGDSNIFVGAELPSTHFLSIKGHDSQYKVRLVANQKGRLGKLIFEEMEANSIADARASAWEATSAVLNLLSLSLDVPLQINQVEITELRTYTFAGSCIIDYADVGLHLNALGAITKEFRFYASMYREALNSNSPQYEFLCLFKIIDSIAARRARLAEEAKARNETFSRPSERFPSMDQLPNWLNLLLPAPAKRHWEASRLRDAFPANALGLKFNKIIDQHLRPTRNRIAHGVLDNGELGFSIDDSKNLNDLEQLLTLAKFMVRRMLKNEFPNDFLIDVSEQTTY